MHHGEGLDRGLPSLFQIKTIRPMEMPMEMMGISIRAGTPKGLSSSFIGIDSGILRLFA